MKLKDRQALLKWDEYRKSISRATSIDPDETHTDKLKRIERLKKDFPEFCKYYFPNYCSSPFADFHLRFAQQVIDNDVCYVTRAWARSHAKSVMAGIMIPLFLKFTSRMKNMLLVSYNETNAIQLLNPLQCQLDANQRIINDFGIQQSPTKWEAGNFKTTDNCSFRAIGSGQSPRGTRNDEARPDCILVDDVDEDEMLRNPKRVDDAWDWISGALFPCFDITGTKRFIFVGNIIAKDSLLVRAIGVADFHEQINIYDNQGGVSWSERYTKEECEYMIRKAGYRNSQREYFNNPITEGKVFKKAWLQFSKLIPLSHYRYLVAYLDPGFKKTKTSDTKSWVLVGLHQGKIHIIKVFCGQASIEEMVEWGYAMHSYVTASGGTCMFKMEEVFLQDLLYKDFSAAAVKKQFSLPLSGDTRKKPEKDTRIEATSGYFERGDVLFNIDEQENHHMLELQSQYLNFEPGVRTKKDGPDAVEGAIFILQESVTSNAGFGFGKRKPNSKRA